MASDIKFDYYIVFYFGSDDIDLSDKHPNAIIIETTKYYRCIKCEAITSSNPYNDKDDVVRNIGLDPKYCIVQKKIRNVSGDVDDYIRSVLDRIRGITIYDRRIRRIKLRNIKKFLKSTSLCDTIAYIWLRK